MEKMPTLFIGHGSPMLAVDPLWGGEKLRQLGQRLPRPEAILLLSAHWLSRSPLVSDAGFPETIHDFSGFPQALYRMRYPAPGSPTMALRVLQCLHDAGFAAQGRERGLDHGAWIPLSLMYPQADIPVLQLSIQSEENPAHHWALGAALKNLREQGVLIIGSGLLTHALGELDSSYPAGQLFPWAQEFSDWLLPRIESFDRDSLLEYRTLAPHARRAHPTDEHLLPLFAAMGAIDAVARVERIAMGCFYGSIVMDSYVFW